MQKVAKKSTIEFFSLFNCFKNLLIIRILDKKSLFFQTYFITKNCKFHFLNYMRQLLLEIFHYFVVSDRENFQKPQLLVPVFWVSKVAPKCNNKVFLRQNLFHRIVFWLLGSAYVKAARKMLVKLTPELELFLDFGDDNFFGSRQFSCQMLVQIITRRYFD